MNDVKEVRDLIKDFTKRSPRDIGDIDPRYREYLAKCSKLFKLDQQLITLSNSPKDEYYYNMLNEIEQNVKQIVNSEI